ncbi:MAG: DUF5522 domain-containing protein [Steroidobacteraceae bacterium]
MAYSPVMPSDRSEFIDPLAPTPPQPAMELRRRIDLPIQPGDCYQEGAYRVFTRQYHLRRGYCCGNGCRHCPYRDDPA